MAFVLGEVSAVFRLEIYWMGILLFLWVCAFCLYGRPGCKKLLFAILLFFVLGFFVFTDARSRFILPSSLISSKEVVIEGTAGEYKNKNERYYCYVKDARIKAGESSYRFDRILVYSYEDLKIRTGNRVEINGQFKAFSKARNPGNFDEENYYHSLGTACKFYINTLDITDSGCNVIEDSLFQIKKRLTQTIYSLCSEKQASIFNAVLLGEMSALDEETKGLYQDSGIAHILAISGMHISFIGFGIYKLCRRKFLLLPSVLLASVFILGYGIMTGGAVSIVRAVIMFFIKLIGDLAGRTYDMATGTALAGLLLLIDNPYSLYNVGFLLSFTAVLAIAVFAPVTAKAFKTTRYFYQSLWVTVWISLLTSPILLYTYFKIPLYSVILNLMVIPLSGALLVSGISAGIAGIFSVGAGRFFIATGSYILQLYEFLCRVFLAFPHSTLLIGKMTAGAMGAYYLIIICFTIILDSMNRKNLDMNFWRIRYVRRVLCIVSGVLLLAAVLFKPSRDSLEITMIDVGQGESMLIQTPERMTIMIDAGSTDIKNVSLYRILPVIKSKGIGSIDYLFLTHMDSDHISGIIELFQNYKEYGVTINTIFMGESIKEEEETQEFVKAAWEWGVDVRYISTGMKFKKSLLEITCLYPEADFLEKDKNENSVVLSLLYDEFSMLFTGDIEKGGEQALLKSAELMDYDVLKTPHHGSSSSSGEEFLEKVNPEYALISCGVENRYGHPHPDTIEKFERNNILYYTTEEYGAIQIKTKGKTYQISTYLDGDI